MTPREPPQPDPEMVKASREAVARGDCLTTEEIRGQEKTKT